MGRITLELPEKFMFSTELPVRITDINYGSHLGNDALLSLLHEARVRFFTSNGWTELDADGAAIIMADVAIVYKSEAFYGDVLTIEIAPSDYQRVSCDLIYRISNKTTSKEVARAKTGIVFVNRETKKPVSIPNQFRTRFVDTKFDRAENVG